jgi:hypothetical protein
MKPKTFPSQTYRNLVLVDQPATEIEKRWNEVCGQEESFWDKLHFRDEAIYLRLNANQDLRLSSLTPHDLPRLSDEATPVGRWIARHSLFARILSSRVGKEEVTFYALLNQAHGVGFDATLDRLLLNIGHTPLCYRRAKVVEIIRRALLKSLQQPEGRIGFLDIGSGGGFDGLDVNRICTAMSHSNFRIVNIDIDDKWLSINEQIACAVNAPRIFRRHTSIFDYLRNQTYREDLRDVSDLIISCNGFADFLQDEPLREMFVGIKGLFEELPARILFVFPTALKKNPFLSYLSGLVGFNYPKRTSTEVKDIVALALGDFVQHFEERHSQIICVVRKD